MQCSGADEVACFDALNTGRLAALLSELRSKVQEYAERCGSEMVAPSASDGG